MRITKATRRYESWLADQVEVVADDLERKHQRMAESPFLFLRATFYRWAQSFSATCEHLADAPSVLGVGDLHVDNFGTWRDSEGRLCWGVNDFDEATELPYTNDLVRLAASAVAAHRELRLSVGVSEALDAIEQGYRRALDEGGRSFVLDAEHRWLHDIAHERDARRFWDKLSSLPTVAPENLPRGARARLERALPDGVTDVRFARRVAGCGSLGRPRVVALGLVAGHPIARETKPLVPSAWQVGRGEPEAPLRTAEILATAVRSRDPLLRVDRDWVVRRLSPICAPIEIGGTAHKETARLFQAMGRETANVHLGTRRARKAILADLARRDHGWLHVAAHRMLDTVDEDYASWCERERETEQPLMPTGPTGPTSAGV